MTPFAVVIGGVGESNGGVPWSVWGVGLVIKGMVCWARGSGALIFAIEACDGCAQWLTSAFWVCREARVVCRRLARLPSVGRVFELS